MSSGNLIAIRYLEESTTFGELEATGNFQDISKTTTTFTGTPDVTQSATVRSDRLPSGNIITGLTINGSISNEFSRSVVHDTFIAATMMDEFPALDSSITVAVAYDGTAGTLTATTGDFTSTVSVGDTITITGLNSPADGNNDVTVFTVTNVVALVLIVVTASSVDDWDATAGASADLQVWPTVSISDTLKSYTFEKQYLDLTTKSIAYYGEVLSAMNMQMNYGSPVTINYTLMGASKEVLSSPITAPGGARIVDSAPTESFFNPTSDMPYIIVDGSVAAYCIEGITLSVDNGLTAKNCVGRLEKTGFDLGTANVQVTMKAHFSDENFSLLQSILDQDVVELAWPVVDSDGLGYMIYVSAQFTGDDPDTTGQDAQAFLELSGGGALASDGTVLRIARIGTL